MLKEIHEQPTAVKTTIAPRIVNGMPDLSECGLTDEMLKNYRKYLLLHVVQHAMQVWLENMLLRN